MPFTYSLIIFKNLKTQSKTMLTLLYVPCANLDEATAIGRRLVEEKLVACANAFPATSMFWWKQRIYQGCEGILILKTTSALAKTVEQRIRKLHSYTLPAILKFRVEANKDFEAWVKESTKRTAQQSAKKQKKRKH